MMFIIKVIKCKKIKQVIEFLLVVLSVDYCIALPGHCVICNVSLFFVFIVFFIFYIIFVVNKFIYCH